MAGFIPGLLPTTHSQEKEFAKAYEDVLERYKGKTVYTWYIYMNIHGDKPGRYEEHVIRGNGAVSKGGLFIVVHHKHLAPLKCHLYYFTLFINFICTKWSNWRVLAFIFIQANCSEKRKTGTNILNYASGKPVKGVWCLVHLLASVACLFVSYWLFVTGFSAGLLRSWVHVFVK